MLLMWLNPKRAAEGTNLRMSTEGPVISEGLEGFVGKGSASLFIDARDSGIKGVIASNVGFWVSQALWCC